MTLQEQYTETEEQYTDMSADAQQVLLILESEEAGMMHVVLPIQDFNRIVTEEVFSSPTGKPKALRAAREMAEGYKAMAAENSRLAEEYLPVAREEWPMWET